MTRYSAAWFDAFLSTGTAPPVDRELGFFETCLPRSTFPRVLDVACGIGRHARALAAVGYEVLGVDVSREALEAARDGAPPGAAFRVCDMRALGTLPSDFDVVACLWQSWGFHEPDENIRVLDGMARRLRPGGRLLLDLYNRDALPSLPTLSSETRNGRAVRTTRALDGDRFRVRIDYPETGGADTHEWQVFTPEELTTVAHGVGLRPVLECAWFDPSIEPGPEHARMQLLFENPQAENDR